MKKMLFPLFFIISIACFSQEEGEYRIDGNNIVVSKIIDGINVSSDEIYVRAKSYFSRAYVNSNAVIQTDDRESGIIIGKGLYTGLASYNLGTWKFKSYHILRVDMKDGKARIICSASTIMPYVKSTDDHEYNIVDYYPITNKRYTWATKGSQKRALENLVKEMYLSLSGLEKAIREGGILTIEQEEW